MASQNETNQQTKGENSPKASQVINERPRPRVLVFGSSLNEFADELAKHVETVHYLNYWSNVSFDEWDCLITDGPTTSNSSEVRVLNRHTGETEEFFTWTQEVPDHISTIQVIKNVGHRSKSFLDFIPPNGELTEAPSVAITADTCIRGSHVAYAIGLPDYISEVVREELVPVVKVRETHLVFGRMGRESVEGLKLRSFLFGPQGQILACSYERTSEASVWLIPDDVPNLLPWVLAAFREWHALYPQRFPVDNSWKTSTKWQTFEEKQIHKEVSANQATLDIAIRQFNRERAALESRLDEASTKANQYERALLTEQGDPFQLAAQRALIELGFNVRDMDLEWPTDARKEDYRISDVDEPDWIAIGEAKGFSKGVAEIGLTSLQRWVEAYLVETKGNLPSARWYIVNHSIGRDPSRRQRILAGRSDIVDMFTQSNGLIIEGLALFHLIEFVREFSEYASTVRTKMRSMHGLLDSEAARAIVDGIKKENSPS